MKVKIKSNVFVIDGIHLKIIEHFYSENPKDDAEKLAKGYFEKGDGNLKHIPIPTKNHPNRFGIDTPTDFFIHYFK